MKYLKLGIQKIKQGRYLLGSFFGLNLNSSSGGGGNGSGWNPGSLSQFNLPNASIYSIIENILNWLLGILGIIGVIGFVIAGIFYLTAAGDESQITKAKSALKYSITGVIVGIAGLVIIQAVNAMLNGTSLF